MILYSGLFLSLVFEVLFLFYFVIPISRIFSTALTYLSQTDCSTLPSSYLPSSLTLHSWPKLVLSLSLNSHRLKSSINLLLGLLLSSLTSWYWSVVFRSEFEDQGRLSQVFPFHNENFYSPLSIRCENPKSQSPSGIQLSFYFECVSFPFLPPSADREFLIRQLLSASSAREVL